MLYTHIVYVNASNINCNCWYVWNVHVPRYTTPTIEWMLCIICSFSRNPFNSSSCSHWVTSNTVENRRHILCHSVLYSKSVWIGNREKMEKYFYMEYSKRWYIQFRLYNSTAGCINEICYIQHTWYKCIALGIIFMTSADWKEHGEGNDFVHCEWSRLKKNFITHSLNAAMQS